MGFKIEAPFSSYALPSCPWHDPAALSKELERLDALNAPTDEMIEKAILAQADTITQYMLEAHGLTFEPEDLLSDAMVDFFRVNLMQIPQKPDNAYFMLNDKDPQTQAALAELKRNWKNPLPISVS